MIVRFDCASFSAKVSAHRAAFRPETWNLDLGHGFDEGVLGVARELWDHDTGGVILKVLKRQILRNAWERAELPIGKRKAWP